MKTIKNYISEALRIKTGAKITTAPQYNSKVEDEFNTFLTGEWKHYNFVPGDYNFYLNNKYPEIGKEVAKRLGITHNPPYKCRFEIKKNFTTDSRGNDPKESPKTFGIEIDFFNGVYKGCSLHDVVFFITFKQRMPKFKHINEITNEFLQEHYLQDVLGIKTADDFISFICFCIDSYVEVGPRVKVPLENFEKYKNEHH